MTVTFDDLVTAYTAEIDDAGEVQHRSLVVARSLTEQMASGHQLRSAAWITEDGSVHFHIWTPTPGETDQ